MFDGGRLAGQLGIVRARRNTPTRYETSESLDSSPIALHEILRAPSFTRSLFDQTKRRKNEMKVRETSLATIQQITTNDITLST